MWRAQTRRSELSSERRGDFSLNLSFSSTDTHLLHSFMVYETSGPRERREGKVTLFYFCTTNFHSPTWSIFYFSASELTTRFLSSRWFPEPRQTDSDSDSVDPLAARFGVARLGCLESASVSKSRWFTLFTQ